MLLPEHGVARLVDWSLIEWLDGSNVCERTRKHGDEIKQKQKGFRRKLTLVEADAIGAADALAAPVAALFESHTPIATAAIPAAAAAPITAPTTTPAMLDTDDVLLKTREGAVVEAEVADVVVVVVVVVADLVVVDSSDTVVAKQRSVHVSLTLLAHPRTHLSASVSLQTTAHTP